MKTWRLHFRFLDLWYYTDITCDAHADFGWASKLGDRMALASIDVLFGYAEEINNEMPT